MSGFRFDMNLTQSDEFYREVDRRIKMWHAADARETMRMEAVYRKKAKITAAYLLCTIIACIALSILTGCTNYSEDFTKYSEDGSIAHTVHVTHRTFLIVGKAATLKTETQTEDFIRNVNATDMSVKTDSEAVKAITEGVAKGVIEGLKISQGMP
jgi:hypothetical protein